MMASPTTDDDGFSYMTTSVLVQVSSSSCISKIVHGIPNVKRSRPLGKDAMVISPDASAPVESGGEGLFPYDFFMSKFSINL